VIANHPLRVKAAGITNESDRDTKHPKTLRLLTPQQIYRPQIEAILDRPEGGLFSLGLRFR
jgi:hypothetical protein